MRVLVSIPLAMLAAGGCASILGLEASTTVEPDASIDASESGGPQDAGEEIGKQEEPTDGEVVEASAAPCAPAARVSPTKTDAIITSSGKTCGAADSVLVAGEGNTFGLDYDPNTTVSASWDSKYVTGCIGLGFVGGPFKALTVRARATHKACVNECIIYAGAGCDTGQWFGLFVRDGSKQKWLTTTAITSSFADYNVALPPSVGVDPYLYICRSSANRTRDDVELDYVAACK